MKYIKYLFVLVFLMSLASCNLLGLDYQENHDYQSRIRPNTINMNVWEYINSRKDIFSTLLDGIEYAEIDKSVFAENENTYLLLTNTALSDWEANGNCYWSRYKVNVEYEGVTSLIRATTWKQYTKKQVRELILYHILKGEWSYHNISTDTKWYETKGEGKFTYIDKSGQTLSGDTATVSLVIRMVREAPIQANNWVWNYRGVLGETSASFTSTNIKATNGYVHVTNYFLDRPTRSFLELE